MSVCILLPNTEKLNFRKQSYKGFQTSFPLMPKF